MLTPQLEERLREVLEDPKVCPHGNPFQGCEQLTSQWMPLTEFQAGQIVMIQRIHEFAEDNHGLLLFLADNGIAPGVRAEIVESLPFNQPLSIHLDGKTITLGFQAARLIFAEKP